MNKNVDTVNNSYLLVRLDRLRENIAAIRSTLTPGTAIYPVLKGDAYGLGLEAVAGALSAIPGIDTLAVAHIAEGVSLRRWGLGAEILVLGHPLPAALGAAAEADLTLTVGRPELLPRLARESERLGRAVKVQLKLDTGLHRVGAAPGEELAALLRELSDAGERISLRGVYSHLADTADAARCEAQFRLYLQGVEQVEKAGFPVPTRHICDSAGSENYPAYHLDAVRLGRRLMMDHPTHPAGNIREPMAWRTWITGVHDRRAGDTLGYANAYRLERDTRIAIVGVGYGDGLPPAWAEARAPVLIRGRRCPVLACCMDQCFVDVTGLDCAPGEEVTLFGWDGAGAELTSQEAAALCGANEGCGITAGLTARVARIYE